MLAYRFWQGAFGGLDTVIGVAVSWALNRYLSALLYGARSDPFLFAASALGRHSRRHNSI